MNKRKDSIHFEVVDADELPIPGSKSVWGDPPFKVGDKVYCYGVRFDEDKMQPVVVEREVLDIVPTFMQVMYVKDMTFNSEDVGEAVLLTREEAKKALAECESRRKKK